MTKALCFLILALSWISSHASLIDRGRGLIYDTQQNITWLKDANYSLTSGYDSDGIMSWAEAAAWAEQLEVGGLSDWRLPQTNDLGENGCQYSTTGGTDCGYNLDISSSEMAHLFYFSLDGLSYYDATGIGPQPGYGVGNAGPFINVQAGPQDIYWSGTIAADEPNAAWYFGFAYGDQSPTSTTNPSLPTYAWAVRDGDVAAVPVLPAWPLMLSGLVALRVLGNLRGRWHLRRRNA